MRKGEKEKQRTSTNVRLTRLPYFLSVSPFRPVLIDSVQFRCVLGSYFCAVCRGKVLERIRNKLF